jgi:phage terminase large subunit GpA-like protein
MPIQLLLLDEVDSFEMDIDDEGDPIKLAVKRTTNFPRRKIAYISTPGIKELSRIEPLFESGDQRFYHVPCPFCRHKQRIMWGRIKFERDEDKQVLWVGLQCEKCEEIIDESHKTEMLEQGEWIAKFPGRERASFHVSALYSPVGFYSWWDAVSEFLEAKRERSRQKLQVWTNTVVAETWSEKGKTYEASEFEKRKESYNAPVPAGVMLLTAGVDVQEDRLEAEVVGWGNHSESWGIDYVRFMGDTEFDEVWQQMDEYLARTWRNEQGQEMGIVCAGIDSGHRAKRVYSFCEKLEPRRIFAVKGQDGWGRANGLYKFLKIAEVVLCYFQQTVRLVIGDDRIAFLVFDEYLPIPEAHEVVVSISKPHQGGTKKLVKGLRLIVHG